MIIITEQMIATVSGHYNGTSKTTSAVSFILKLMRDNIGSDLMSVLSAALKARDSRKVVNDLKSFFNKMATLFDDAASQVFNDLAAVAGERASALPPTVEDLRFPSVGEAEYMLGSLMGAEKAIATLIWNGGLKLEDLARDEHKLAKIGEGVVNVVGNYGSTRPRQVTSDNSFGLTPEMVDDLVPILQNKLFSSDELGLEVNHSLQPFTSHWQFTPSQLRVGHAERLLSEGMSFADVADIQGVRAQTIRNRQRKYKRAN